MILLTTSDYFPMLGGLSTFTKNIESALTELGLDYKLIHWKKFQEIQTISSHELEKYSFIVNIHPQFAWLSKSHQSRMVNFIHGSEILMTSPNLIKRIYKKINRHNYFSKLSQSYLNIFISEATLSKATSSGFKPDYSRDIILHNCIDASDAQFVKNEIKNKLIFSCIVRNVPHKNLIGSLKFCELVASVTGKEVELIVPSGSNLNSNKIHIRELITADDLERDEAYKASHFNLLLSLDQSKRGFFEGFGLTVLEAGRFATPSIVMNTGGLSEAVHHGETGWVISEISPEVVKNIFSFENISQYQQMTVNCYSHTIRSHSLNEYIKFFSLISDNFHSRGAA